MPTVDLAARTALYRLFDEAGQLLYVGIAVEPRVRWGVHAREKTWWPQVARRDVEWLPDRVSAEAAEVAAIVSEAPRYNVAHSMTRQRGDAKTEYRRLYAAVPRQVRIATQAWRDFGLATKAAGTTRATVIRELIRWYLREPGARMPERPARQTWEAPEAAESKE